MLNCSPQSSLPVPWPFWELRGCTAGDITLFKERAGVARSAQIIPAVKQNLIKVESFFFSLRLCHGVFLQSENYKLRTKRTHCCGKQGKLVPTCNFWIRFLKIKFKMLVGLCPNPLCSASGGCRLHIFEKCFLIWVPMPVVSALFAQPLAAFYPCECHRLFSAIGIAGYGKTNGSCCHEHLQLFRTNKFM